MGKTALLLIATLLVVPVLAFVFDRPLTPDQVALLTDVSWLMLGVALACFVVGEVTGNVSQVDKLWSIVPVVYCWVMTAQAGYDPRMVLMSVCATVWGVRLTYNFSRHGGYSWKFWTGHEDYRWDHVRAKPEMQGPVRWRLFHLGFICLYQNALLLLIALPILMAVGAPRPLGAADWLLAAIYIGLVAFETVADQQQWNYQAEKRRQVAAGKPEPRYARGFVAEGLWSLSRHPNYFAEQSIWLVFFLFSVAATGRFNWTAVGCVLLMLLFQGSANLKESICAAKYPAYPEYARRTPRFLPRLKSIGSEPIDLTSAQAAQAAKK
jgi:steroid 5-alpha reductase family enzyme